MRRSIATVCLSGTLEEKLTAAARAGFDGVEVFEVDLVTSPLTPAQVRQRCDDLGLGVDLYQPFRDFEAVPADVHARNLRRAEAKFDVMEQLGTDTVLVCSSVSELAVDDDDLATAQLHALADRAGERGLRIAYEALAWGRHVSDYEHSWRIVAAADHAALGVCLDSFHILSRGSDPGRIRDIPGEKLFFLQLADAPHLLMDVLQWSRHYRCFPGQGGFDLPAFLEHVLVAGYPGPLSLEVFNDVFRAADPDRTAVDALRSLLALEESLRRRLDEPADEPAPTVEQYDALHAPPPPVPPDGVAFVELAVDGASREPVGGVLAAMGFAHLGQHRSKPVELWQQAGARVLLNSGTPAALQEHDPVVTALGLDTADPASSALRAEALLAPRLPRSRGPRELDLAAVAAPDGTSLLFCRTGAAGTDSWRDDFLATGVEEPVPVVTGVDHVALAQPIDHFDEGILFYRSVLGLEAQESLDLASPYGLVRSRALTDGERRVRLALNVDVVGGGGRSPQTQHVAFACGDVFAAAAAMRDRGTALLPVSPNYYDDLAARVDLDTDLLRRLREHDVLYDRDARGEFLHFYTHAVGHRLFFEVVQRVGAYDGYGAQNAPVRLAAQRRLDSAAR